MLNNFTKINFLLWGPIEDLINLIMRGVYGLYFGLIRAIAWILDMLTQLFFIFAGMTPVSSTTVNSADGKAGEVDIVNFFLTQKSFQKAYLYLCLVALGLIVVFTIGKIIKQDYFDRNGPRSKGPIFRSVALSFIAFICVIPIFYFLIDVVAALALLVMQAMGYKGGGIGSLIFNICWDDNGESVRAVAQSIGNADSLTIGDVTWDFDDNLVLSKTYDPDNFGWYSGDTFYAYYWNAEDCTSVSRTLAEGIELVEFHVFIFIFTGLILIVNLGQMLLAMVTRMYNLIALFIVAPSPISQIVLDDGQKFKGWKDKVIQEALKVVGCVMSFMLFIMIVSVVNELDLMRYAFTEKAASSLSLIEDNNLTTELSNSISGMYYNDSETATYFDKAINALARCMIIIAGVGAIKDIDQTITPFISGSKEGSMNLGNAGNPLKSAGKLAAQGALDIGKKAISGAVGLASAGVGMAAGIGLNAMESAGGAADAAKQIFNANREDSEGAPLPGGGDNPPGGGDNDGAQDIPGDGNEPGPDAGAPTDGEGGPEEANDVPGDGPGEGGPEEANDVPGDGPGEGGPEEAEPAPSGEGGAAPDVDAAKENLDNATIRDNNKNFVLDEMEKILDKDPKDRTEADNKKLKQLEKAFDQIDASGDTKFEAQKKYDEAVAAQSAQEGGASDSAQDGSAATEDVPGADIPEPSEQEDNDAAEDVPGGDTPESVNSIEETQETAGDAGSAGNEQINEAEQTAGATDSGTTESGTGSGSSTSLGAPASGNSSNPQANNENVRFASLHEHGRLGTGAKIAKGALAATGFTTTFASKLAFGTAGQVLKHGKKAVGTTAKTGLSIASIAAKTILGMTGMGGVANAVGGFVGDVVADTTNQVKGLGKNLKKQGSDFAKRNMKMVDSNGDRVDKDGNRLDSSGNVMKDKDGNAIKGVGDPTYQSSLGAALGAAGNMVSGAKNAVTGIGRGIADGSIVSGQLRYASGVIDRASRERTFLSDEAERRLNNMDQAQQDANNMIADMNDAVSPGSDGDYSSAAGAAVEGAEQQLMVASDMNNLTENMGAERNAELDVNDSDVERINNAYAAQENYQPYTAEQQETIDQRNRLGAIASDVEGTEKANARKEALDGHFTDVVDPKTKSWNSGKRSPFLGKKYGGTNNWRERSQRLHAIYARSQDLDGDYKDVLDKVNSGEPVDADTMEAYSQYLDQARKLDNAYMYVHSGYGKDGQGQEDFESIKYELEHGVGGTDKDVNPDYNRANNLNQEKHFEAIRARAEDMAGLSDRARKEMPPEPEPQPRPEEPENIQASAATKLKAASIRADAAKQEYDRVTAEGSGASDEDIAAAEAKVQETIGDVAKYSNEVSSEYGKTKKAMLHASRDNERRNVGNENFERAVSRARTSVSVAKSKGKISQSKADKLNSQIDAMESAGQDSYNDGSRAVRAGRSGVKGTRKIMNKTLHVRAKSGNLQDATSSTPVPDRIRTSRSPNPMSTQEQDEILVNLSVVEEEELNQGVGQPGLVEMRNACVDYSRNAWAGMQQDADAFMSRVAAVNVDTKFKDEVLTKAISEIKQESVPTTFKGSLNDYKRDAMNRYDGAVNNYNSAMENASRLANQYSMDKNPETLKAVQDAIQVAVRSSEEIRGLKIELNIEDKD